MKQDEGTFNLVCKGTHYDFVRKNREGKFYDETIKSEKNISLQFKNKKLDILDCTKFSETTISCSQSIQNEKNTLFETLEIDRVSGEIKDEMVNDNFDSNNFIHTKFQGTCERVKENKI